MSESICIHLPQLPPSVNAMYRNNIGKNGRVGRFKTEKYRHWHNLCLTVTKCPENPILGPVRVVYTFDRPDKRRRDVFNLEKAVSDFLVAAGFLQDDSQIIDGRVRWGTEPMEKPVHIKIVEV